MKRALCSLFFLLLSSAAYADSARMPDGTQFLMWEKPLHFTKTYYVDNQLENADDNGPGTKERPFRTINHAAQVLQPGERVVIAEGVYREVIRPARGGNGTGRHDQLRGCAGRQSCRQGFGRRQGLASQRRLELRRRPGYA